MTSTERAKAFISNKLKKTALIILPLAAAAVQAHASVAFTLGSGSSFGSSGNSTNPATVISADQLLNGVNGISLFGKTTFTTTTGGSGGSSSCASICAGYFAFGGGSGTFDSNDVVVNYDFILTDSNGQPLNWTLGVNINNFGNSQSGTTAAGGEEVIGSFLVSGLSGAALTSWNSFLQIDFAGNFNSGDTIGLNVPEGASVDIGAAVPEPGTGALMAIAGAVLAGLGRFRRRLA